MGRTGVSGCWLEQRGWEPGRGSGEKSESSEASAVYHLPEDRVT